MKGLGLLLSLIVSTTPKTAFRERFPQGVVISGVSVGNMTRTKGQAKIREELKKRAPVLRVRCGEKEYAFSYPEVDFTDDLDELFLSAKPRGRYEVNPSWFVKGLEDKIEEIAASCETKTKDALVRFTAEGFFYEHEQTGLVCNREALREEIETALHSPLAGELVVSVKMKQERPKKTVEELKKGTRKIASFRTYFDENSVGRSENIRLCARFLDGRTLFAGEEFSFNLAVGERTKKRGFREANVIDGGKFVKGTGGGVCQVSTTVYNAAMKSGMRLRERNPHSLAVSYVSPSCDAMVSARSDLRFQNPFPYPVYLSVKTGRGWVEAVFYGKKTDYEYRLLGVKTGEISPPEPEIKYGEEEGELKAGKAGVLSEGYLETYFKGALVSRKLVSRDSYQPLRGVIGKKRDAMGGSLRDF